MILTYVYCLYSDFLVGMGGGKCQASIFDALSKVLLSYDKAGFLNNRYCLWLLVWFDSPEVFLIGVQRIAPSGKLSRPITRLLEFDQPEPRLLGSGSYRSYRSDQSDQFDLRAIANPIGLSRLGRQATACSRGIIEPLSYFSYIGTVHIQMICTYG